VATFWIVALGIKDLRCRPPLNHEISVKLFFFAIFVIFCGNSALVAAGRAVPSHPRGKGAGITEQQQPPTK